MARCILVIDDDPQIRAVASASLRMAGREVLTAGSGAEGIVQAAAGRPDAILLDVMMPGMDGPTTLRRLRADPATADIPVIMLTATTGPDGGPPVFDQPVAAVIPKPFDIMDLPRLVAAALGWDA